MSIYINKDNYIPTEETVLDDIYKELQQLRGDVDSLLEDREEKETSFEKPIDHTDWIYATLKMLQVTIANKKSTFNVTQDDIYIEHLTDPDIYVLQIYMSSYTCRNTVKDCIERVKKDIIPKALENIIFIDIFFTFRDEKCWRI